MAVFVIGNGASRSDFDLELLRDHETVGCNAIVRDWDPDYVVMLDGGIINHCVNGGHLEGKRTRLYVPHWRHQFEFEHYRSRGIMGFPPRENAGAVAIRFAVNNLIASTIYLIGMDSLFYGHDHVVDPKRAMGNMYLGTTGYDYNTATSVLDTRSRAVYVSWLIDKYSESKFVFVNDDEDLILRENMIKKKNVRVMSYADLFFC